MVVLLLNEPSRTNYDINFDLFGFPIRVHPAFFVMPLLLGGAFISRSTGNAGVNVLILISVFFVSILVHELGHAFAFRYFGQHSRIVLYWMGGLAIPDSGGNPWSNMPRVSFSPEQQIIVSLAGPIFGFLLAIFLCAISIALGGEFRLVDRGIFPIFIPDFPRDVNEAVQIFLKIGIWANIFFNILNLVPVYPLDGGQVARQLFVMNDAWNGVRFSIYLSIAAGAIVALASFASGDRFLGIFFAIMAWSNYTTLQSMGGGGGYGGRPW